MATQLPDLIDKPLGWTFGVLPNGRMFAHSLVVVLPGFTLGCVLASRRDLVRPASLVSLAYPSHIVGEFYPVLWLGTDYNFFPNLIWPLLPANPNLSPSFAAHAPPTIASLVLPSWVFLLVFGYIALDIVQQPPAIISNLTWRVLCASRCPSRDSVEASHTDDATTPK